jgi:hypothetical protein
LAEKHAPVVRLVEQDDQCGHGEPYVPIDVARLLGNNEVVFRGPWDTVNVVKVAPTEAELDASRVDYHLDFPGNPLDPGCDYERFGRRALADSLPTTYARVVTEAGKAGRLALQYWFFYVFNDWNNKHEGDWEMVQLVFDADDASDALTKAPSIVGYSQHEGAEQTEWGDEKLEIVDGARPVVYPAAGSHANFYSPALYLGRSAAEGVGCDDTRGPHREIRPVVAAVPSAVQAYLAEYPWLEFPGRWGEKQPNIFNGPTGPNQKAQWTKPITWAEQSWRDQSFAVPAGGTFGTTATDFFCGAIATGSSLLTRFTENPAPILLAIGGLVVLLLWAASRTHWEPSTPLRLARRRAWGQLVSATGRLYTGHFLTFVGIGLLFVPIGLVITGLQAVLFRISVFEPLVESAGESNAFVASLALGLGILLSFLGIVIVQTVTALAMARIDHAERARPSFLYRESPRRVWTVIKALLIVAAVVVVLNLSVVGIPVAIWLVVRWGLMAPLIALEGAGPLDALRRSARLVKGHWWKAGSITVCTTGFALILGPVVGALLLLASDASFDIVNMVAAVIYVFLMPFAAIATTYLYFDLRVRDELAPQAVPADAVLPAEI